MLIEKGNLWDLKDRWQDITMVLIKYGERAQAVLVSRKMHSSDTPTTVMYLRDQQQEGLLFTI
jgi:hypothetical protein